MYRYHKYRLLTLQLHAANVAVSRECVLTAFSIKPSEELLNKIREFAAISGLDKLEVGKKCPVCLYSCMCTTKSGHLSRFLID
jgi:hypothetical protein